MTYNTTSTRGIELKKEDPCGKKVQVVLLGRVEPAFCRIEPPGKHDPTEKGIKLKLKLDCDATTAIATKVHPTEKGIKLDCDATAAIATKVYTSSNSLTSLTSSSSSSSSSSDPPVEADDIWRDESTEKVAKSIDPDGSIGPPLKHSVFSRPQPHRKDYSMGSKGNRWCCNWTRKEWHWKLDMKLGQTASK